MGKASHRVCTIEHNTIDRIEQRSTMGPDSGGGSMIKSTTSSALVSRSTDDIARRAYEIYLERGQADGFDREDWLRAERELGTTASVAARRASTRGTKAT